jgi:hypothetical protein
VLEINLDASTTYFSQGQWLTVKDINQTKMLKHFQDVANGEEVQNISLS